jgi:hypothetical protein
MLKEHGVSHGLLLQQSGMLLLLLLEVLHLELLYLLRGQWLHARAWPHLLGCHSLLDQSCLRLRLRLRLCDQRRLRLLQ